MTLFAHQQRFLEKNPDRALLAHEMGTGKTLTACHWLKKGRDSNALVICPKRIIKKWEKELTLAGTKATVVSKEDFKRYIGSQPWSAVIVDEADQFAAPLFTRQRSQLAEALYNQVKKYPSPILLLTATPVRSTPWNLHTLLVYLGHYIDYKKWRERFFSLETRPFMMGYSYFPKKGWQKEMRPLLEKYADIVLLKDCVDYLPPVTEETVMLPIKPFIASVYEPAAAFVEEHRYEQKDKLAAIMEISKGFRKVIVVAHYVEQVETLAKELGKERQTFMVHGGVKRQEEILKEANECDECFLVIQASLSAGFDADTFSTVIFASMSYRVVDFIQMRGRVRRIHNLHPVKYYYLIAGRCDKAILKAIEAGKDFVPSAWK